MSRRYWLPILAVVGLALAAHAQEPLKADRRQPSAAKVQTKPEGQAQPSDPVAIQRSLEGIRGALEATNRKQKTSSETESERAQIRMAEAAEDSVKVAFWSVIVTAVGVLLVLATLLYTKAAAEAARDAVKEARKATKVGRKSATRQLRAYISIVDGHRVTDHGPGMRFQITIKNSGQTPAREIGISVASEFAANELSLKRTPVKETGRFTLGPGLPVYHEVHAPKGLTKDNLRQIESGEMALFFHGQIDYSDSFGSRRYTKFRLSYGKANIPVESLSPCNGGNVDT